MSTVEYRETCKNKNFMFKKRFKWFSLDVEWIKGRVQDGKFNNSNFIADRYKYLISFEIEDKDLMHFSKIGKKELMLDRRKAHNINILKIF